MSPKHHSKFVYCVLGYALSKLHCLKAQAKYHQSNGMRNTLLARCIRQKQSLKDKEKKFIFTFKFLNEPGLFGKVHVGFTEQISLADSDIAFISVVTRHFLLL